MPFKGAEIGLMSFIPEVGRAGSFQPSPEVLEMREIKAAVRDIAGDVHEFSSGQYEIASYNSERVGAQFEAMQTSNQALLDAQSLAADNAQLAHRERLQALESQQSTLEDILRVQGMHIAIASLLLRSAQNAEANLDCMCDMLDKIDDGLARNDRLAALRHVELLDAIRRPAQIKADEKYAHGLAQFDAGHLALAAKDLRAALGHVSVHVPSLLLLGRVCVERGLAGEAKALFRRTAKHAAQQNNLDAYASAMIRLSHVERIVGNLESAYKIMVEALTFLRKQEKDGDDQDEDDWEDDAEAERSFNRRILVAYETLKARWAVPANQNKEVVREVGWELRHLYTMNEGLREEVAELPLFASLREYCPWLGDRLEEVDYSSQYEDIGLLLSLTTSDKYPKTYDAENFMGVLMFMNSVVEDVRSGYVPRDAVTDELLADLTPMVMCMMINIENGRGNCDDLVALLETELEKRRDDVSFLSSKVSLYDFIVSDEAYRKKLRWQDAEPIEDELSRLCITIEPTSALFAPYHAALAAHAEEERVKAAKAAETKRQAEYEAKWGFGEAGRLAERAHLNRLEREKKAREAAVRQRAQETAHHADNAKEARRRLEDERSVESKRSSDRMWMFLMGLPVVVIVSIVLLTVLLAVVLWIVA